MKLLWGILAIGNCFAQTVPPKSELGVFIGDNFSWYTGLTGNKADLGYCVGLYSRFMLNDRLSIDPRIYFINSIGASGLNVALPSTYSKSNFDTTSVKRSVFYFTVNAPVSYHFSPSFILGLGPQFMVYNFGNDQYKSTTGNSLLLVDNKALLHKYDAGVTASIAYRRRLSVGLMYYYGLMYVVKQDGVQAKNSTLQLWVGVPFRRWNRKNETRDAN